MIPPEASAEFVYHMEDVIDVYTRPYDPLHPVICFDESNKQLVGEIVEPLPMEPGKPQCYDYQYERNGVCNLFMFSEPLMGWRHVAVTDRRTKIDYAQQMKYLVDERYPSAELITVIHDQLNTHVPAALYEAFEPAEARRILGKLEFHYTPKHGSWLNMAEIELSVLSRQCARPVVFLTRSLYNERLLLGKNDEIESLGKLIGNLLLLMLALSLSVFTHQFNLDRLLGPDWKSLSTFKVGRQNGSFST